MEDVAPRHERPCPISSSGMTVLRHNAYTVSDIVQQLGKEYMSRSIAILANPETYRRTVLYDWLLHTCLDERGTPLRGSGLGSRSLSFISRRAWVCSLSSRRCTPGAVIHGTTKVAPSNATLTVQTLEAPLSRTNISLQPWLRFDTKRCFRIRLLARVIMRRIKAGECQRAPPHTSSVHLRLGDKPDIFLPVRGARSRGKAYTANPAPEVSIAQQTSAIGGCTNGTIVLHAVAHFLDTKRFGWDNVTVRRAEWYVKRLRRSLDECGVRHEVRSVPDVDDDMCFIGTASSYLHSVGGFSHLMREMRAAMREQGFGTANERAPPGSHESDSCAWLNPRLELLWPSNVSICEQRQASCAAKLQAGRGGPTSRLSPLYRLSELER